MNRSPARALLLDRDGVINVDTGYVHRLPDVVFLDGIFRLVRAAVARNFRIVIVTNQAGIAKGYYPESAYFELMAWMEARFAAEQAPIDRIYHCPYHPDGLGEWRRDSPDRKPGPGMILRAASELGLCLKASILVGDRASDIAAARAAGVGCAVLLRGPRASESVEPDAAVQTLDAIIPLLDLLPPVCAMPCPCADAR